MRSFFTICCVFLAVLLLAWGAFICDAYRRENRILPRTVLGDMYMGGLSHEEARKLIRERLDAFVSTPIQIAARGQVQQVTLKDLGIVLNESQLLDTLPFASKLSNPEIVLWSIAGRRITPDVTVERTQILRAIYTKFPSIPKTKNAHFMMEKKRLVVVEAIQGVTPNIDPLLKQVKQNVLFLESKPLFVSFTNAPPDILAADLEESRDLIQKHLPKIITLTADPKKWPVDFEKHPEWIVFERKAYEVSQSELPFSLSWDPIAFANFMGENVSTTLEQEPQGVRIWQSEEGKVEFDGKGSDGRTIEREKLLALVNKAISNKEGEVVVPVAVVPAKIEIADALKEMGVTELLSIGYTRFEGSPTNRAFNIGVGIQKFNGVLIPPGEIFSFGKNLGEVDGSTGYRKELVIKPEGTIPEYGGGICQVSSTMYRAAIFAGLPIVERKPHSYAVSYYAQVGGHGLDATVYPPNPDLKFKNDTTGHILVQSYTDGPSAYFKFYGTPDGRTIKMDGPYITNRRSAPSEPLLVPSKNLQPGEKKQVEKAHGGFDTLWYRYLTKNGETKKEEIVSRYRAVPNKYLFGGEAEPLATVESPVNPFE